MALYWSELTEKHGSAVSGFVQESYTFSLQTGMTRYTAKATLRFLKSSLLGHEEQHCNPFQTVQHLLEITTPLRSI